MSEPKIPRNYQAWEASLPDFLKQSPIWRLHVYRDALFAFDLAKYDVQRLKRSIETRALIPQLYRATGSIGANLIEVHPVNQAMTESDFLNTPLALPAKQTIGIMDAT